MSASRFEAFLAKLYVDEGARARFLFDSRAEALKAGLTAEEVEAVAKIDRVGLDLFAKSLERKRQGRFHKANHGSLFSRSARKIRRIAIRLMVLCFLMACLPQSVRPQDMKNQLKRGHEMLEEIKTDIKENYFDPKFGGINLESHFKEADDQIALAVSGDQIYGIIAQTLLAFDDSHTYFIPPVWSMEVHYGWEMQMIGESCYVTSVTPGSDAAGKGLKAGLQVLSVFDVPITRSNLSQLKYLFYRLRPLKAMLVSLKAADGTVQQVELLTKVEKATWATIIEMEERQKYSHQYLSESGSDPFIWKMPSFDLSEKGVDEIMKKVGQSKALILDLRGNGGGYESTLQYLLGYFFDHDVKIGDRKGRKDSKPVVAKMRGDKIYKGKVVVLVDSGSASAAEILARVIQLENRGTVIGDRTAGAVMEAKRFYHDYVRRRGTAVSAWAVTYGLSVTINNLIMTDGKSLERVGVTPDKIVLPNPADLESQRDPQLALALELTGAIEGLKAAPHVNRQ